MWIKLIKNCPKYVALSAQADMVEGLGTRIVQCGDDAFDLELGLAGMLGQAEKIANADVVASDDFEAGAHWASVVILEAAKAYIKEKNDE